MAAAKLELAHIVRRYGDAFIEKHQPLQYHARVLNAIASCRTAVITDCNFVGVSTQIFNHLFRPTEGTFGKHHP